MVVVAVVACAVEEGVDDGMASVVVDVWVPDVGMRFVGIGVGVVEDVADVEMGSAVADVKDVVDTGVEVGTSCEGEAAGT